MVRARSVLDTPGAARWLSFGLSRFRFLFFPPGFPAVDDLRQDFPDSLNFFLRPDMHSGSAKGYGFRGRYFSRFDVVGKSAMSDSKLLSSLSGGEIRHIPYSVCDKEKRVKRRTRCDANAMAGQTAPCRAKEPSCQRRKRVPPFRKNISVKMIFCFVSQFRFHLLICA
jgi:hypothetical protein